MLKRTYILVVALFSLLLFLQYRLWFETGGLGDLKKIKQSLALQTLQTDELKKQNDMLVFQIERLQKSQDATESRARNELGMIKKDETFYQIIKDKE